MILVENWAFVEPLFSPYFAPEQLKPILHGNVFNHPDYQDGHHCVIRSHRFVAFDGDCRILSKSGKVYRFGAPHAEYESQYPGSRARLLESFRRQIPIQKF
jgi:hypothetical protein